VRTTVERGREDARGSGIAAQPRSRLAGLFLYKYYDILKYFIFI
jgi:hypothetical protein